MKTLNLNQKITLKGLTSNVGLLISSNYTILEINEKDVPDLQIENKKYDVISINPELFVHKNIIGRYFTYRVSSSPKCEFTYSKNYGEYQIRAGEKGIIITLKIENIFNNE